MKKNKAMRLASTLLVVALLTACAISGTFAKYTTTATNSDSATVAKWSLKLNNDEFTSTNAVTFGLFDTVNETNLLDSEKHVVEGDIAPGTGGSFDLEVTNASDVDATYTIKLEETNTSGVPLRYSLDGETWTDSISELTMTGLQNQSLAKKTSDATASADHTVYWRWVFDSAENNAYTMHTDQTDVTDTALGVAGTGTVEIKATITATQVN